MSDQLFLAGRNFVWYRVNVALKLFQILMSFFSIVLNFRSSFWFCFFLNNYTLFTWLLITLTVAHLHFWGKIPPTFEHVAVIKDIGNDHHSLIRQRKKNYYLQWNLDLTDGQGTDKICSLQRGSAWNTGKALWPLINDRLSAAKVRFSQILEHSEHCITLAKVAWEATSMYACSNPSQCR